jgi:dipeptidyl aminopeptidase/acylaminoacyl peptidase
MHHSFFISLNLALMKNLFIALFLIPITLFGQDKIKIDHNTYDSWNSINELAVSSSGKIVSYQIMPFKGDGYLYFQNSVDKTILDSVARGQSVKFHFEEKFAAYTIGTQYDSIRQLKLDKVKKDKFPKDTLGIYWIDQDSTALIPNIKSFKLAEEGDWMAYLLSDDTRPDCKKKKCKFLEKRNKCIKEKTTGTTLVLYNPITNQKEEIFRVKEYYFDDKGTQLAYVTSEKGEVDSLSLTVVNLSSIIDNSISALKASISLMKTISTNTLSLKSITFDKKGDQLTFLSSADTNKRKTYLLSYWNTSLDVAKTIVDSLTVNMPENWTVSEFRAPYFSKDGKKLFFGTTKIVEQEVEDTLLASEKSKVDVWSWTDKKLQPMQLKQLKREQRRTYLAVYHLESEEFIQLANELLPSVRLYDHENSNTAMGVDNDAYLQEQSWAFPWKSDYYKIDIETGDRKLIKKGILYGGRMSPSGNYFVWYNGVDSTWHAKNLEDYTEKTLTNNKLINFASDNNGNPFVTYPEGMSGWINDEGQEKFIVYSEFDIWLLDPSGNQSAISITAEQGKVSKIRYRINNLERDSTYIVINNNLIHGFNTINKDEFYVKPNDINTRLLETNHSFYFLSKARKSDMVFYRKMNFQDYPELYSTDMNLLESTVLTETNPQQKDYNWGTVDLVHWDSYKGLKLDGLLYKPENFDSTKSYPMIVYFYEKYADDMHRHYVPKPTASIIYATEYVSNGYIVFIPDVKYTEGHPAASAYDCILSGTDHLTQKHSWIDTTKMALQGQSWGGYQTAQLITMTDKYACGMAGAPVSNMFSAYGGVRWGSGMSRAFQYERTQSRIGCTIWDCPELYTENSPIFGLPNVHTPVLIMHNDGDGAVPWYQGIEMYMGLRRLDKPVWMLNYNGDQHNLMKNANREDLSIRMRQFFDYYLLDAPIPLWMKDGVKAVDKGKKIDLQLSE